MLTLPADFLAHIEALLGKEETGRFMKALNMEPVTSVRVNPLKNPASLNVLTNAVPVPWTRYGYYLNERPSFTFDPLFHAGAYYVQEASSMFIEQVLTQKAPLEDDLLVLDLCAAPGGKSTHLASLISKNSILVSNEVIASRVGVLAENLQRWGKANVIVTNNDPEDFHQLENCFDVVVIDAPCSGEGMFRKDHQAVDEWSVANVELCSARQKRILEHALTLVKPGGYLVYSTCTFSPSENEKIIQWVCNENGFYSERISLQNDWNVTETITPTSNGNAYGYRFYPHKVKGEGFFVSCLRKNEGHEGRLPKAKKYIDRPNTKAAKPLERWIENLPELDLILFKENILAFHRETSDKMLSVLNSSLKIRSFGTEIGQLAKDDLVPSYQLAMSELTRNDLPSIELSYDDAIAYLQKKDMKPATDGKGWYLMRYHHLNLGWGKILPNRMNNYYPMEWRIRKEKNS